MHAVETVCGGASVRSNYSAHGSSFTFVLILLSMTLITLLGCQIGLRGSIVLQFWQTQWSLSRHRFSKSTTALSRIWFSSCTGIQHIHDFLSNIFAGMPSASRDFLSFRTCAAASASSLRIAVLAVCRRASLSPARSRDSCSRLLCPAFQRFISPSKEFLIIVFHFPCSALLALGKRLQHLERQSFAVRCYAFIQIIALLSGQNIRSVLALCIFKINLRVCLLHCCSL